MRDGRFLREISRRTIVFIPAGEGLKSPQLPKAKQLVEVTKHSIGLTEGIVMARIEIDTPRSVQIDVTPIRPPH
ncbi:hypothetical protein C3943_21710 [Lysinibacillus sp. B2A1]|nr:hypothetical protein C3943_21710 [Lysinibacillus sp. B2A1]